VERIVLDESRMECSPADVEPLTNRIIACAIEVHKELSLRHGLRRLDHPDYYTRKRTGDP
jgi:hypothetical protein